MSDEWSLYKHTSPSGKVYIGIAKDVKHRWRANGSGYKGCTMFRFAIQKYGWENFTHEILAKGLSREEASALEKHLIAEYKSTDPRYGYNLTDGGYDGIQSKESRIRKSNSLKGHAVSESAREKLRDSRSIEVICIETNQVFKSAKEASKATGICAASIGKCCSGKSSHAGGYHFAKMADFINDTVPTFCPNPLGASVMCLETGEVFRSQSDAAKAYGVTSQAISHACTGKVKTSANLHWKFVSEVGNDGRRESL